MRDNKFINDISNLIKVVIDFNDKLYERAIRKWYDQFHEKARIFFKSTIKYY